MAPGEDLHQAGLAGLAGAIARRRTERRAFAAAPLPTRLHDALRAAARQEGAWLVALTAPRLRPQVADLVAAGGLAQWSDPAWRRERAHWMRPATAGGGLALPWLLAPLIWWVVRRGHLGSRLACQDRALAQQAPLLAVLGTDADRPLAWLRTGQTN